MNDRDATLDTHADATTVDAARRDLDYEQARLAYSVIEILLEHTRATNDLVALMAQALDEDAKSALTSTPVWESYLESRRAMKRADEDLQKFAEEMKRLGEKSV